MGVSNENVEINSRDYWFKIVEFLQQNWALIELSESGEGCVLFFIGDTSGVFDQIEFQSVAEAERQLRINGFKKYKDDEEVKQFIASPKPPFHKSNHPNGAIYSSGRYWMTK